MNPRICYFIPVDQFDENGYIPSLVTEGESGHAPLRGNGRLASPWHWGKTYEEAKKVATAANFDDFGLSEDDVFDIIASSMRAVPTGRR
jgi:hypothetical protein